MHDKRIENLAKIAVEYSTEVKEGDRVVIRGFPLEPDAAPLIRALYREVLKAGGYPHILVDIPGIDLIQLNEANKDQLRYVNPFVQKAMEEFDVDIRLSGSSNTKRLMNSDQQNAATVREAMRPFVEKWFERSATGAHRWVVTRYPTDAYAQDAEMSLKEYEDYFFHTSLADTENPVELYMEMGNAQERLIEWLDGKHEVQLIGPDIDLRLSIEGRNFINCCGKRNLPDGEIFTGPVEESLNGWVRFSYPTAHRGFSLEGVELQFADGRSEKVSAIKGEKILRSVLESVPGADYIGELGIGTNRKIDRLTQDMLLDEKIWGTIHLALGAGYPETGSKNKSALHWDMLCDMRDGGRIIVDGELFYEAGEFQI